MYLTRIDPSAIVAAILIIDWPTLEAVILAEAMLLETASPDIEMELPWSTVHTTESRVVPE